MRTVLLIALGGAAGSVARHGVGLALRHATGLPWGTLAVNVAGSLVLGWSSALALDGVLLALVGVGFCGGLTTWSGFAVQVLALGWRRGSAYASLTVAVSLGACAFGFVAGA